jgi:hypothetical protein
MRLLVSHAGENVVVSRPEIPRLVGTMTPDVYRPPFAPLPLFTMGTPLEAISHTLSKILWSVT